MLHRNFGAIAVISAALIALLTLTGITGASAQDTGDGATPEASPGGIMHDILAVVINDVSGEEVGTAQFVESDDAVTVTVEVTGIPQGDHGIHIHETGLCEPSGDQPFSSAGGHFNPTGADHGGPPDMTTAALEGTPEGTPEPLTGHAGDLGNITVGENGLGSLVVTTDRFTLSPGEATLFDEDGSAIVIHADPDDLTTDPSGNSGARIACGVIVPAMEGGTPAAASPQAGQVAVMLTEFEIQMPAEIPTGSTTFEVSNAGTIVHNFEIEGQGIEQVFEENLQPGETKTMTVDLPPGTYEVYCPVGNHAEQGMRLELTVIG
jgi:Cu-Zn family superoxide dismutase